jgi:fused signal recognition particle receptor
LPAETVAAPEADTVSASPVEKEDAEAFAADVVEVTEQVVESELPHSAPVTPAVEVPAEAEETPRVAIAEAVAAELPAEEVAARSRWSKKLSLQPVVAEAVAGQTPEAVTDEPQVAAVDDTLSDETRGEEPALSDEELEALALASQPLDDEAVIEEEEEAG